MFGNTKLLITTLSPTTTSQQTAKCSKLTTISEKQQCWDNLINQTLQSEGLAKAFELFGVLFNSDRDFASDCHGYTHTLGKSAYALFAQHKEFELTKMTSYCGYGFYHGFMEELIHKSGKVADARKFCLDADIKLHNDTIDAGGACFHGIGHGFVEDTPDSSKWGNPEAIIQPGLDVCEKIADDTMTLFRCTSGVFNAIEILMDQKKFNLTPDYNDPFSLCKKQPDKYKKSCYTQLTSSVLQINMDDFIKAFPYINAIQENEYAVPAFTSMNVERIRLRLTDYDATTYYCRSLPQRFYLPCITSFAEGFLKYGPPEKEYVNAVGYCNSQALTFTEKKACFGHIAGLFRIWYSKEKSLSICKSINPQYLPASCDSIY